MRSLLAWGLLALSLIAAPVQAQQPTNPKFPVFVFTGNPLYAAEYKATGADRFWDMWRVGRPLSTQLDQIRAAGMTVVGRDCAEPGRGEDSDCLHDFVAAYPDVIKGALGWDEPDAAVHQGQCLTPTQFTAQVTALRAAFPPGFPVGVNYGPGFSKPTWQGRGPVCTQFDKSYLATTLNLDFYSFDNYPDEPGTSLDAFRFRGDRAPIFFGVDRGRTYKRFAASPIIYSPMAANDTDCARLPTQQPTWPMLRATLWTGFVAGARGPVIFYHCIENGVNERRGLDLPNQRRRLRDVLDSAQKLRDLALGSDAGFGFGSLIDTTPQDANIRCKASILRDRWYMACVTNDQRAVTMRFSGPEGGQLCVLEEGRRINPGAGNLYTDTFDSERPVHIYTTVRAGDPVGTCGDASARFPDVAYDDTFVP